ncbi:MAG TPA: tRNA-binding protein [Bacteroidia bacterium]|nr:tRNA-binding protein [Bacteroidia bacterium]
MPTFDDFAQLDIRAGTIIEVNDFPEARKPAYKLVIDFGEAGIKKSSAQITDLYSKEDLLNKQIVAVINFPPKQVGKFISECLVLGTYTPKGVVLLQTERGVVDGDKVG